MGARAGVYELQGDLTFAGVEAAVWRIVEGSADLDFAILDLRRVSAIDEAAAQTLLDLQVALSRHGKRLVIVHGESHSRFLRFLAEHRTDDAPAPIPAFAEIDRALEWTEERLLESAGLRHAAGASVPLAEHQLCRGLEPAAVRALERLLERQTFPAGELIVRRGDAADRFFLLTAGTVSVTIDLPSGRRQRVATLSGGMTFGELAIVSDAERTADVRADEPAECYALSLARFRELGATHPEIKLVLLENLLRNASQTATRLTGEVAALAR